MVALSAAQITTSPVPSAARGAGVGINGKAGFAPRSLRIGRWTVDRSAREVSDGDVTRRLSPRAIDVLSVLAEARGDVVRRSDMMDAVWPDVHVGDESLTQAVVELRRALGHDQNGGRFIETVPKVGYRLTATALADGSRSQQQHASPANQRSAGNPLDEVEAHLAMTEARRLAKCRGVLAVDEIDRLVIEARKTAPNAAHVQAEYAIQMVLAALHAGDRNSRLVAAGTAAAEAVRLRPDLMAPHRAQGFLHGILGNMNAALQSFSRALTIDPDDFEAHYLAAKVAFGCGLLKQSIVLGERAAELDPDDYRPAYNAARAALKLGDQDRARQLAALALRRIEAQLQLTPTAHRLLSARAAAASMLGRFDEAIDAILARAGRHGLLYDCVALTHYGEIDLACDLFERIVDGGLDYPGWINADPISDLLGRERRFSRALDRMQAA